MSYLLDDTIYLNMNGNIGINTSVANAPLDLSNKMDAILLPTGTTIQRPSLSNRMMRYNIDHNNIEFSLDNNWFNFGIVPQINSVSTAILKNIDDTITVSGSNFTSDGIWTFLDASGNMYLPKNVTYISDNSVTITRPDIMPPEKAPYTLKVKQYGRYNTYKPISAGIYPTILTPGGSLGIFNEETNITPIDISANDESGGGIASMAITSGNFPPGLTTTFTPSGYNGIFTISGLTNDISSTTVYTFTLLVTDAGNNTISQQYSLTINHIPLAITSSTPTNIDQSTTNSRFDISYNFTSNKNNVIWSINNPTYATIDASLGRVDLSFNQNTTVSGTFTVTATKNLESVTQSWTFNVYDDIYPYLYPSYTTSTKSSVLCAFSFRKLYKEYTGPIVRLRRSIDNSENDFYVSIIDNTFSDICGNSLLTWLATGRSYIRTLYDQSGLGRHAVQATLTSQPLFIYSPNDYSSMFVQSVVSTDAKFLTIGSLTLSAPFTFLLISRKLTSGRWITHGPNYTPNTIVGYYGGNDASFYMDNNPGSGTGDANTLGRYLSDYNVNQIHMVAKSTNQLDYYYLNGYLKHLNIGGTATNFGNTIYIGGGINENSSGYFMEMVIHNITIPTTELSAINYNIESYYGIASTLPPTYLSFPNMSSATQIGSTVAYQVTFNSEVYEISANSQYDTGNESITKAFDRNGSTRYTTVAMGGAGQLVANQFIRLKFPVPVYAQILRITNHSDTTRCILTARLLASTDDISYNAILTIPSQETWVVYETREFYVYNSNPYQYYKLQVDTATGSSYLSFGEVDLLHTRDISMNIPFTIPNLELYLDAAYHNSGRTTWVDRSNNRYNFTINAGAYRADNGIPHMNFEGSYYIAKRIVSSALTNVPAFNNATFIVFSTIRNVNTNYRTLIRGATSNHQIITNTGTNDLGTFINSYYTANFNVTNIPNYSTKFNMLVWKFSTSSPYYQFKYNKTTIWYTITDAATSYIQGFACIGGYHNATTSMTSSDQYWGKIALVLYYSRHLTDTELNSIHDYYSPRFNLGIAFTSVQPTNILQSTITSSYTISYTFTLNTDPSDNLVKWTIFPTTFGDISNNGTMTLRFPQATTASGTFTVTARNKSGYVTQSWNYDVYNYNTSLYPTGAWAILDASMLSSLSNNTSISEWGIIKKFMQGTAANRPTYISSGGYNNGPYVFFNRTNSAFLNAEFQTLNISTNGGFTIVCQIKYTGSIGTWERIIDFGNGAPNNNIHVARNGASTNISFELFSSTTSYITTTTTSPIVAEQWMVVSCRWIKGNRRQIFKNNILQAETTFSNDLPNRTLYNVYIGRSNWADAYLNAHISKMYIYDRNLSDTEMSTIYAQMIQAPAITSVVPGTITQNTSGALYQISYTFTGIASIGTIVWSINNTTYGDISSNTGTLTLTFPRYTTITGSFIVTATDPSGSSTQTWAYNITNTPLITSSVPATITQSTAAALYTITYSFIANQPVTWSINNTTYGDISSNGSLILIFPRYTTISGTFIVTATNAANYTITQSWTYTITNIPTITSVTPTNIVQSSDTQYQITYNFVANQPVTWSINNTTYGNIDTSGALTLIFPQNTNDFSTLNVTATNAANYTIIQSWTYIVKASITLRYPVAALTTGSQTGTTTITAQTYGNGIYGFNASSQVSTAESTGHAFNLDNAGLGWTTLVRYNSTTGAYTGSSSTTVSSTAYTGEWIQLQLPYAVKPLKVFLSEFVNRNATSIVIGGSNDGTTWTSLYINAYTPAATSITNRITSFEISTITSYNYYRLIVRTISSSNASGYYSLGELAIYSNTLIILSSQPANINRNTSSAKVDISYNFTASQTVTWSLDNTTYGDISSNTGYLLLSFPRETTITGSFTVTATSIYGTASQTWTYTITNIPIITPQPTNINGIGNTVTSNYDISYNFVANQTVIWSINNTTYGDISSNTGYLALSYPQGTDVSGTYIVSATNLANYIGTVLWSYVINSISALYSFTTFTFTNATATGRTGPTLTQCRTAYSSASWTQNSAYLNIVTQGIQEWIVPFTGIFNISLSGAAGGTATLGTVTAGGTTGGAGRIISGSINLSIYDKLYIIVGQLGQNNICQGGGGGATFIFLNSISFASLLFVAGGGGGATHTTTLYANSTASSTTTAFPGNDSGGSAGTSGAGGSGGSWNNGGGGSTGGSGSNGTGGNGGQGAPGSYWGGGGGGAGSSVNSSATFLGGNGGTGGNTSGGIGGFGGGAGAGSGGGGGGGAGGGGGYNGGGGGGSRNGYGSAGGGGSTFVAGTVTNINTNVGTNTGNGYVTIST